MQNKYKKGDLNILKKFKIYFDENEKFNLAWTEYYLENQNEFPIEFFLSFVRQGQEYKVKYVKIEEAFLTESLNAASVYEVDPSSGSKPIEKKITNPHVSINKFN
jgi:hypothetical protein